MATKTILSSSVAERSTVNRLVVGSNPTWGVLKKLESVNYQIICHGCQIGYVLNWF